MRLVAFTLALSACAGKPHGRSREQPGLGPENTVPASAQAREVCNDATLVTLADIAAGKGSGERIAIDLVPEPSMACTELDCGDAECCNRCDGGYGARLVREPAERDLELHLTGSLIAGCSGMDCNHHCEPFGRKPAVTYRFVGTNTFVPAGTTSIYHQAEIAVETFCTLSGSLQPN